MKNRINILTALICAFALSVVSLNFVEAATGTSGLSYKSQGRIVFTNNPDPSDDVVFDASDFTTIDQVVVNGKNQVMSKLNEYKDENGNSKLNLSGLQSFDDLANAVDTITSGSNAAADQILAGSKAMVGKNIVTGTMVNNGAVTQSLNAGGSYTIPAGYHNGQGKITANSLASQTSATAGADHILSGKTAWVNGTLVTGTMTNRGSISRTINPGVSTSLDAGYYSGGTITANTCTSTHVDNQDGGTVTPGTSNKTITPDSSHTGLSQVVVAGDSDLIAENIKSGVNIFGVTGSLNSSPKVATFEVYPHMSRGDCPNCGKLEYRVIGNLETYASIQNPLTTYRYPYVANSNDSILNHTTFEFYHNLNLYSTAQCSYVSVEMIEDTYGIRIPRSADGACSYLKSYSISGKPQGTTNTSYVYHSVGSTSFYNGGGNQTSFILKLEKNILSIDLTGQFNYMAFREFPKLVITIIYE